ncbi:MAG: biotin--[acetyl-CoA-carboxylase] ligase [Pirellulaceae bacterium]
MSSSRPQNSPSNEPPTGFDLGRVRDELELSHLFFVDQRDSTNDWALELARTTGEMDRALFLTRIQTAGRGRGTNRWLAGPGSLTFSLLIPNRCAVGDRQSCLLPLAVGCGVSEALARWSPEIAVKIKWPNDLYWRDRKLGGVLVESVEHPARQLVIGCGINVNNELGNPELENAISLAETTTGNIDLTEVLIAAAGGILEWVGAVAARPHDVVEQLRALDWLKNRRVKWEQGDDCQQGVAMGIADDGGLYLESTGQMTVIYSGSITPLEGQSG